MALNVRTYVYIFTIYVAIAAQWSILSCIWHYHSQIFQLVVLLWESTYLCSFAIKTISTFYIYKSTMLKHFEMKQIINNL